MEQLTERLKERSLTIRVLGGLVILAALLSVANEFANLPTWPEGLAAYTRPIHVLLGLIGIFGLIFGFRTGYVLFALWILVAIPYIAPDRHGLLVDTIFEIKKTSTSSFETRPVGIPPYFTQYRSVGINLAPILFVIGFLILLIKGAFPLFKITAVPLRRVLFWSALAVWILAHVPLLLRWQFFQAAPFILVPAEEGISFHFRDETLPAPVLVNEDLLRKLGLDASTPMESWEIRRGKPSPWGQGIFIWDGTRSERIDLAYSGTDREALYIETPWGHRATPRDKHEEHFRAYYAGRNPNFIVTPTAPGEPVAPGEHYIVRVRIEALKEKPTFAEMRFSTVHLGIDVAAGEFPKMARSDWVSVPSSDAFIALNTSSTIEADLSVKAPHRPGTYSLHLNGWMYDSDDKYAKPVRSTGYSHYALVTVGTNAPSREP